MDIPGVSESRYINELGRGTSIKVMDKLSSGVGGILANRDLVREMKQIAKAHDIPYQIGGLCGRRYRRKLYADLKRRHQERRHPDPDALCAFL